MALDDQQMQFVQISTKEYSEAKIGKLITDDATKNKYKLINTMQGTTQAIAVAPIKYDANGEGYVDYSQIAIAAAGTQPIVNDSVLNSI